VFENRVLRRIFGPKREEVTGGWRKLHNEELLFFWLSHQYPICIPLLPHSSYMPCPSHPP
jgi:hypothetical protein